MVMGETTIETEVLVIGSGPGGYAAAYRAADLDLEVTMVDPASRPGGVCLHRGCIPSKTLLQVAELLHDTRQARGMGLGFNTPDIDLEALRQWKHGVINRLADGLQSLSQRRDVQQVRGRAVFESSHRVRIHGGEVTQIKFNRAILAAGSRPIRLPGVEFRPHGRIMSSTGALELADIPASLLVVGGGYVGLELGMVYAAFGSRVTLLEGGADLLTGVDPDLVKPLVHRLDETFESIHYNARLSALTEDDSAVQATWTEEGRDRTQTFDRALVAVGRQANTRGLGLETTRVQLDDRGYVQADPQQRTADAHIWAVGDIVGGMLLAHKATHEGKVAAEVIAGQSAAFDARAIPAVVYTDPQIAWCGLTETEAQKQGQTVQVKRFPWKFSGRAATLNATDGLTKIIIDPESERILGMGIVGRHAEGLIAEGVLAVEMGAQAQDLALSVHPHPTLSETESEAAEMFLGSATHILNPIERH